MRITLFAVAIALLGAGCGASRTTNRSAGDQPTVIRSVDPSEISIKIVGGTPEQHRVIREVLAGLGPTGFTEVEIQPSKPGSIGLVVPHDTENVLDEWQSWLLAQGFGQRSRELGLPFVSYLSPEHGDTEGQPVGQVPRVRSQPDLSEARRAAKRAREAAAAAGAQVTRLEILRPDGYAFLVELQVKGDPAQFLRHGLPKVLGAVGGPQSRDEMPFVGDYTLVIDGHGKRIWEGMEAASGDGSIQMGGADRWDLEGCSPFFRSGPPGRGPPPCPADSSSRPARSIRSAGA